MYDALPSPSNLHRWGLVDSPACQLYQRTGTLEHILSCYLKALGDGGYCWRHDQVLRALADTITAAIQSSKSQHPSKHSITFVRAGEKAQHQPRSQGGLLANARDWHLQVDLGRQLKFPVHMAATSLRPDMVITVHSHSRAYCPLGGQNGGGKQALESKVCRAGGGVQEQRSQLRSVVRVLLASRCSEHSDSLELKDNCAEEPLRTSQRLPKKPHDGCGSGGGICGVVHHLDMGRGKITPSRVAQARVSDDFGYPHKQDMK